MVDLRRAQLQRAVTSVNHQQQIELQESQFRQKTLELAGVNREIAQCWQDLATKTNETSLKNLGRALRLLVLKRTKLLEQLADHFSG